MGEDRELVEAVKRLNGVGVRFEKGLSDREVARIERKCGFLFPPDLGSFLQYVLPAGGGWEPWRSDGVGSFRRGFEWVYNGICFDIEHAAVWPMSWGEKPQELADCFDKARASLEQAPKMVPIWGHRFIPDRPNESGNPVFSIFQTDIIHYAANLSEYFENEFHKSHEAPLVRTAPIKDIP